MTGADAFVLAPIMDPEAAEREEAPREKKDKVSGSANWVARRVARRRLRAAGGNTHSRFDDQDRFGRSAPEAVEVGGLSLRRRVPWQPGPDGTTCSPALGRTDTLLVLVRVCAFFFWGGGVRSPPAARPATTRGRGPRRSPGPTAATRPRTWATSRARDRRMGTRTRTGGPDQDLPRRKTSRLRPGGELPSTPALPSPSVLTVFIALFLRTPSHASAAAGA